jgi:hypothetical protein
MNTVIPVVDDLLIRNSAADYNTFFEKILDQDTFEPLSIMTDFDSSTIKCIQEKFPRVLQGGNTVHRNYCYFRIAFSS